MDAAAKQFSKAFDSGMLPMEFVNKMKKDGKLIMGIGHRVKSVSTMSPQHVCRVASVDSSRINKILIICFVKTMKMEVNETG